MSNNITVQEIHNFEGIWRAILEQKGYVSIHFVFEYEPALDQCKFNFDFYNTEWSAVRLPNKLTKCSLSELGKRLNEINDWVASQPDEEAARDAQLLKDFAAIKERIDASKLSDLIKAEVAALMEKLSSNILEDKSNEN